MSKCLGQAVTALMRAIIACAAMVSVGSAADPIDAGAILAHLDARRAAMRTVQMETDWETARDGVQQRWESQYRLEDPYGRIRVRSRGGGYDSHGQRVPDDAAELDDVYNGQATVSLAWYPDWDSARGLPSQFLPPGEKSSWGYFAAQIHEGPWPAPYGPRQFRDPLTFIENDLRFGLEAAIEAGLRVDVMPAEAEGVFVVRFRSPDPRSGLDLDYEVTVDGGRGWIVLETSARASDDSQLVTAGNSEFSFDAVSALWLPVSGRLRRWEPGLDEADAPSKETRFSVTAIRINDPGFPGDAFAVSLPVGTAVSDMRFGVNYRIGDATRDDAALTMLAATALAETTEAPAPRGTHQAMSSSPQRALLLAGNLVMLVAVVGWVVYSSHRPRLTPVSQ